MGETAQGLAFRAMTVGKYFGDKDPNDCALADCVGRDEGKDADRDDRVMLGEERPCNQTE